MYQVLLPREKRMSSHFGINLVLLAKPTTKTPEQLGKTNSSTEIYRNSESINTGNSAYAQLYYIGQTPQQEIWPGFHRREIQSF
uniref:Uncharacterized protein n=1 Tax=Parascaris univalens TaxID=6257 RepID=A0A915BUV9_PARUN